MPVVGEASRVVGPHAAVVDPVDRGMLGAVRAPVANCTAERRPTVALVAHNVHEQGGMERVCAELVRRGSASYRFVVVASELAPALRSLAGWKRVAVPQRPFPLKFLAFAVLAGLRLRRSSVDLVHAVGAIVPNRIDVASVHFCHAGFRERTGSLAPPGRTLLGRVNTVVSRLLALLSERWSYRPGRVRLLAAVSTGVAGELRRHYPHVPICLSPNGIDVGRFRPDERRRGEVRLAEGVGPTEVVCLFIGGDWDRKGLGVALEGVARGSSELGGALQLWVVGRGDEGRFRTIAQRGGVGDRVRFFGIRADPERFYQAADIFVLPTLYETFSLAAFEAAASGLPLIAPAVSGIEELIGKDEAGIIVERTPESVASALARLAADPELRARLGEVGRRRAAEYTWERSVESVLGLYRQLLADRGAVTA